MTLIKIAQSKKYIFKLFKTKFVSPQLIIIMLFFNLKNELKCFNFQFKFSLITSFHKHKTHEILPRLLVLKHLNAFDLVPGRNPLEYLVTMHLRVVDVPPVEPSFIQAHIAVLQCLWLIIPRYFRLR